MHTFGQIRCALAAILLSAALLLGGCSFTLASPTPPSDQPAAKDYSEEYDERRCYRSLSPKMQKLYAAMYAAVRECSSDTWISIHGADGETSYIGLKIQLPEAMSGADEARLLFNAFTVDNPQFFYIGNTYSYEGYRLNDVDYYDVFCLTMTMDAAEREAAQKSLDAEVSQILAALPQNATDYEIELFLHDALTERVSYDNETAAENSPAQKRPAAFTAFGALVEGSAVCEGYSRAMQLLLNRAGIPCTLVSGSSLEGEAHMWNLVEIDGRGYHLDVTWDDSDDLTHHTFFNLTTEEILLSHTIDRSNLGVDTCTSALANFYRYETRYLDTYDRSIIAHEVAQQVLSGTDTVELQFSEETFANAQLFFSSTRRVRQFVEPFLEGGSMWSYTCQVNDTYRTLILHKVTE